MILSGHQPGYLPGLQFFSKVMHSDAFMFVPNCQYVAGSWHSHNFIRSGRLTVPVHATLGQTIGEVTIDYDQRWRRKHTRAVQHAYSHFPYYDDYFWDFEESLEPRRPTLADLTIPLTELFMDWLDCRRFIYSTSDDVENWVTMDDPIDMIIEMCKTAGCDSYLSNAGSKAYIGPPEEVRMARAGIASLWLDFKDPDYGQPKDINGGRFSALDLLMLRGPDASDIIRNAGRVLG